MEEGRKTHARKGCIKTTTGPWIARRVGADGAEKLSLRRPSQAEREKNQQRERLRRSVKAKIFACLRTYGNYHLPKHPDHNDILKALCEEAGWHVEEDGTIYRKETAPITSKAMSESNCEVHLRQACEEDCRYNLSLTLSLPF